MPQDATSSALSTQLLYLRLKQIQQSESDIQSQIAAAEQIVNDQFNVVSFENLSKVRELNLGKANLLALSRHLQRKEVDERLLAQEVTTLEKRNADMGNVLKSLTLQKRLREIIVAAPSSSRVGGEWISAERASLDTAYQSLSTELGHKQELVGKLRAALGKIHFEQFHSVM